MTKIIVMMSGGVDSSVTALLCGKNAIGVNIKTHDIVTDDSCDTKKCCTPKDTVDARSIAMKIGIPFSTVKMENDFKREVIDNFINEYKNGRTPSPCVRCNTFIKIGLMYDKLSKIYGDIKIATGHYAKVIKLDNGRYTIGRSSNILKDQSYFLWNLGQNVISNLLFPIGDLTKDEVREIARKNDLITADKTESQDICFIPGDYRDFLKKHISFTPGNFIFKDKIVGKHNGKENFTIGQRKGINVNTNVVLYVKKILNTGDIILTDVLDGVKDITLSDINYLAIDNLNNGDKFLIQTRLRSNLVNAHFQDGKIIVDDFLPSISPGQSLVAYDLSNNHILFGGIIN